MTPGTRTRAGRAASVLLPLLLSALVATFAAAVTGFGADAAISFAQAARTLADLDFPTRGLVNSHEFWNPNGLVLLIVPLVAVAPDPLYFCVLLSTAQAAVVLLCFRWLATAGSDRFDWAAYAFWLPPLLFTPVLAHTAVELWAQYVGRTILCLLFALAASTGWHASARRDAALGFVAAFAPAVHLGLLPAVPIAFAGLVSPSRRARVRFLPVLGGAVAAVAACWLPWILGGGAASAAEARLAGRLWSRNEWAAAVLGPVIDLPRLLTDPYEGWLHVARARLLAMETERALQAFTDVRCLLALAVLAASALLLLARRRVGTVALEMLGYVMLLLYAWEAKGAGMEQRPDLGGMALQAHYLGVAAGGYRLSTALADRLRGLPGGTPALILRATLLAGLAAQLALGWRGTERIARDVRRSLGFTLADIPLEDKMAAMAALRAETAGRGQVVVAYHNPAFHSVFPYVARYAVHESPPGRDYRPGSFFEAVMNRGSKTRYAFVDPGERPENVLTYPPGSAWASAAGYERLWAGPRLALWRRR